MKRKNSFGAIATLLMLLIMSSMVAIPSWKANETVAAYGFVFDDRNGNGVRDVPNEDFLPDVKVELYDVSGSDALIGTDITVDGYFEIQIPKPGYYQVIINTIGEVDDRVYFGYESSIQLVQEENWYLGYIGLYSRQINATLTGTVLDGQTGEPVNGASVVLRDKVRDYETQPVSTEEIHRYDNNADKWLITPNITIGEGTFPTLRFKHWYSMEAGRDGGNVQVFVDGQWQVIDPIGGYPPYGNIFSSGEPGYSGSSNGWKSATFTLSKYENNVIRIGFRFTSDGSDTGEGWYLDDISLENQSGVILFSDGAEIGQGEWSFLPKEDPWERSGYRKYSGDYSWHSGKDLAGWYSVDTYNGTFELEVTHSSYSPFYKEVSIEPNNIRATLAHADITENSETIHVDDRVINRPDYSIDYITGEIAFNISIVKGTRVTADYDYLGEFTNEGIFLRSLGGERFGHLFLANVLNASLYLDGSPWANYTLFSNGTVMYDNPLEAGVTVSANYSNATYRGWSRILSASGGESSFQLVSLKGNQELLNHTLFLFDGGQWHRMNDTSLPGRFNYTIDNLTGLVSLNGWTLNLGDEVWGYFNYSTSVQEEVLTNSTRLAHYPVLSSVIRKNGNPLNPATNYSINYSTGEIGFTPPVYLTDSFSADYFAYVHVEGEKLYLMGGGTQDVSLFKVKISGIAMESGGTGISNTDVHLVLYDTQNHRLLEETDNTPPAFSMGAYPGNFTLIIDIPGYKAFTMTNLTIGSGGKDIGQIEFNASEETHIRNDISFVNGDWNNITLSVTKTLPPDGVIEGLDYDDVGNVKLQIDLSLGNGDTILNATELAKLEDWIEERGPMHVLTDNFFLVNNSFFELKPASFNVTVEPKTDMRIDSPSALWINATSLYNASGIPKSQDEYTLKEFVRYDTASGDLTEKNYTYSIVLPTSPWRYEMVENQTNSNIDVRGFNQICIDPPVGVGGPAPVDMTVRRSENGTARIQIVGPEGKFSLKNETVTNYTAVVAADVDIEFTAANSTDPNSPNKRVSRYANFTWIFNQNDPEGSKVYGISPTWNYTTAGEYVVSLTIRETGGNVTQQQAEISVDGLDPTATISVNVSEAGIDMYNANGKNITVDEGMEILFSSGNSTDLMHGSTQGEIQGWRWNFDAGRDYYWDQFLKTYTRPYLQPGDYIVNLSVSDSVGHWSENASMTVHVNDITPPEVSFIILDEDFTQAITVKENTTVHFNGSESIDNVDDFSNLTYCWNFSDGSNELKGKGLYNVSHVFEKIEDFNVTLSVTDQSGNTANLTITLPVRVNPKLRPDMYIVSHSFSKESASFEEGQKVRLSVNVSNKEDRGNATGVEVHFYLLNHKTEEIGIGTLRFYNETGAMVSGDLMKPGEVWKAEIEWTPHLTGNLTLRVNVTAENEWSGHITSENTVTEYINIHESPWTRTIIYGVIIALIILVPILIWLRGKYKRGELGAKKEKKKKKK